MTASQFARAGWPYSFSNGQRPPLSSRPPWTRNSLARPENVLEGKGGAGKAHAHRRRLAVITDEDEVVHAPENRQVFLQHPGIVGRIAMPDGVVSA